MTGILTSSLRDRGLAECYTEGLDLVVKVEFAARSFAPFSQRLGLF
jgi:hypothetical protein